MSILATNTLNVNTAGLITNTSASFIQIPTTAQSFESFYNAFQTAIQQTNVWTILANSGIGSQIQSNFASLGTACQFYSNRSLQESFIDTAQSQLSVYAAVNLLGGTIYGNSPSVCSVSYNATQLTQLVAIPAYSTFNVNGGNFHNPEEITIDAGSTGNFTLVEGEAVNLTVTSDGTPNQVYYVSNGYKANRNVFVTVADGSVVTAWSRVDSLWLDGYEYQNNPNTGQPQTIALPVFQSVLYTNGQVQVNFGDGKRGIIPPLNNQISITAYECSGGTLNANFNTPQSVTLVSLSNNNESELAVIQANVSFNTSRIVDGSQRQNVNIYKQVAPARFASNERYVSPQDYAAALLSFQFGNSRIIKACRVVGERNIQPGNVALANLGIAILVAEDYVFQNPDITTALSLEFSQKGTFALIDFVPATYVEFDSITITVLRNNVLYTQAELVTIVQNTLIELLGVFKSIDTDGNWNITQAQNDLIGASWYLSQFYNNIKNAIGTNECLIDYSYQGITSNFSLDYFEYLAIDFTSSSVNIIVVDDFVNQTVV